MQSVIYSTILLILSIEAVPYIQNENPNYKSVIHKGNEGIILYISNGISQHSRGYKDCSNTADLSKYGEDNFQNINSTKVNIYDPINHGYLLHVPNRGPGWKTKNKTIIKKVLEGDTYITDNDCGLTLYYSEEGELLYFKNNGIIANNVFLQSDNLNDYGSYYEFLYSEFVVRIDKRTGSTSTFTEADRKYLFFVPSLPGGPNMIMGGSVIYTEPTKPTDIMTPNDTEKNTKNESETQFHSNPKKESPHETSSESERDDVSEYETAKSEFSSTSENDEPAEEYESNVSPIPSARDYNTSSAISSQSDYDIYSSTSSGSKDDTYSSTSSESKDDTYSSTSPESEDDTYSSISSKREDDTYSSTSSESKDDTYTSNDHHTDKFSDNKIRKRFVFVDTQ